MSCPAPTYFAAVTACLVILLQALAVVLVWRRGRRHQGTRTADAGKIERETRRIRAGQQPAQGEDRVAPPASNIADGAIKRMARTTARTDYRILGRRSGNPFSHGSPAHAIYRREYDAEWSLCQRQYPAGIPSTTKPGSAS